MTSLIIYIILMIKLENERGAGMEKKMDFITWIQKRGGIKLGAGQDLRALTLKESGFVGLVSKKGTALDVLRDEAEWEGIIPRGTSSDEFMAMVESRVQAQSGPACIDPAEAEIKRLESEYYEERGMQT